MDVDVCVFGVVPDICVRSRLGYVEANSSVGVQQRQGAVMAAGGTVRAFKVRHPGLACGLTIV